MGLLLVIVFRPLLSKLSFSITAIIIKKNLSISQTKHTNQSFLIKIGIILILHEFFQSFIHATETNYLNSRINVQKTFNNYDHFF